MNLLIFWLLPRYKMPLIYVLKSPESVNQSFVKISSALLKMLKKLVWILATNKSPKSLKTFILKSHTDTVISFIWIYMYLTVISFLCLFFILCSIVVVLVMFTCICLYLFYALHCLHFLLIEIYIYIYTHIYTFKSILVSKDLDFTFNFSHTNLMIRQCLKFIFFLSKTYLFQTHIVTD